MAITVRINEKVRGIVQRATPAYVYEAGKRTESRVLNAVGQPVTRLALYGKIFDDYKEFTAEVSDVQAQSISQYDVVDLAGENLSADIKGGDFGSTTEKIINVDEISHLTTAEQLFSNISDDWED